MSQAPGNEAVEAGYPRPKIELMKTGRPSVAGMSGAKSGSLTPAE
jgi:hypothetical protein